MKVRLPDPQRWRKGRGDASLEGHLGQAFDRLRIEERLSPAAEARILLHLRSMSDRRRPFRGVRFALGVASLVALTMSYGIATGKLGTWRRTGEVTTVGQVEPPPPASAAGTARARLDPLPSSDPPAEAPTTPTLGAEASDGAPRRRRIHEQDTAGTEVAMLGEAYKALRLRKDGRAALVALDAYDARHPEGAFSLEALNARVTALLLLERSDEALRVLESLHPQRRSDAGLATTRAELRARSGNCQAALSDFTFVIQIQAHDSLLERALKGRAHCLAAVGDDTAARADLGRYVERFPNGRFVEEIKRTLSSGL